MTSDLCRFCGTPLGHSFCDLGMSPLSNAFVPPEQLNAQEAFYPLHAFVCERCFLVQLGEVESPERIFSSDYGYFSSYSESWLRHAKAYVDMIVKQQRLGCGELVIEIASNDGYLLQYFAAHGVPVLGIEPAANVAQVAQKKGIRTILRFFGADLARDLVRDRHQADLIVANNVLAHVPALSDFMAGLKLVLKPNGIITLEFPHLVRLMAGNQFDTIYHEHFSYFSLFTVEQIFAAHALVIYDVEELSTHGGSLRIYARHARNTTEPVGARVRDLRRRETEIGIDRLESYISFAAQVKATKRQLLRFCIEVKERGNRIVGYGAAAKGNTLLNYCGIRGDFLDYVVDRSPHKQGRFLPGTRIPVYAPERIAETRPDYLLILPWNLKDEVMEQMASIREWGGKFVVPIPQVTVVA